MTPAQLQFLTLGYPNAASIGWDPFKLSWKIKEINTSALREILSVQSGVPPALLMHVCRISTIFATSLRTHVSV